MNPSIEPHPGAPEGSVIRLPSYRPSDFPATSAILCRNNAPVISFALQLLRRNIPCRVLGRDVAAGLLKLIDSFKTNDTERFAAQVRAYSDRQAASLRSRSKFREAASVSDRCSALLAIAGDCPTVIHAKAKLDRLFSATSGVTLSTIHKAKGLEWPTVFILDWHLLPAEWATGPSARQERNLQYIAVTRAIENLIFIRSGNWL